MIFNDFMKNLYLCDKYLYNRVMKNKIIKKLCDTYTDNFNYILRNRFPDKINDSDFIDNLSQRLHPTAKFISSHNANIFYYNEFINYKIEASFVHIGNVMDCDKDVTYIFKDKAIDCYGKSYKSNIPGILIFIRYFTFSEYAIHNIYISPILFIPTDVFISDLCENLDINIEDIKFAYPNHVKISDLIYNSNKEFGISYDLSDKLKTYIFDAIKTHQYFKIRDLYEAMFKKQRKDI